MLPVQENTTMELKISGFNFIYAGKFILSDIPSERAYLYWRDNNAKSEKVYSHITTAFLPLRPEIMEVKETAYIVLVNETPVYVGEFSGSLRSRWIKTKNYIWHHKDHLISAALRKGENVTLFLLENPEAEVNAQKLNIAKAVEHHLLKQARQSEGDKEPGNFCWNRRNANR